MICTVTEPSPFLVMAYAGGVPAMLRASKTAAPTPVSPSEALAAGRESVELRLQRKTGGEAPLDFGESILGGEVERRPSRSRARVSIRSRLVGTATDLESVLGVAHLETPSELGCSSGTLGDQPLRRIAISDGGVITVARPLLGRRWQSR